MKLINKKFFAVCCIVLLVRQVQAQPHSPPYSVGIFKPPPPSPPPPPPPSPSPPPSPPPATPNGLDVCFTGSGGTTGAPYNSQGCPLGSCISTITVTPSDFNGEPVFSGLTATCTNAVTKEQSTFLIAAAFYDPNAPTTSITVRNGLCFTGISASVVINPGDNGLYVSTITTNENPPQFLGYVTNASPYNLPERPLGTVLCSEGSYLTTIFGRSGLILDELCFVCNSLLQSPPPILVSSSPPPPSTGFSVCPLDATSATTVTALDGENVQVQTVFPDACSAVGGTNVPTVFVGLPIMLLTVAGLSGTATGTELLVFSLQVNIGPFVVSVGVNGSSVITTYNGGSPTTFSANSASRRSMLAKIDFKELAKCLKTSKFPDLSSLCNIENFVCTEVVSCIKEATCMLLSNIQKKTTLACGITVGATIATGQLEFIPADLADCAVAIGLYLICNVDAVPFDDIACKKENLPQCKALPPPPPPPPPTCEYPCQCGNVETFHSQDDLIAFCTGGDFGSVCCSCATGFGYPFCVVFGRAGCALTVGCE